MPEIDDHKCSVGGMEAVSSRQRRDSESRFQDLLHGLNNWEQSLKGEEKNMKEHAHDGKRVSGNRNLEAGRKTSLLEANILSGAVPLKVHASSQSQHGVFKGSGSNDSISSSILTKECLPDANSEKDLGNEYFKQKKYRDAIECYSRSIALSPTAVAFANRAMAYLKIKRYVDAENDCTEALNYDDRYIKAYSRRATARKELGKLVAALEDAEFALRLEPNNQEIKKQYADIKALYEKDVSGKVSQAISISSDVVQTVRELKLEKGIMHGSANVEQLQVNRSPNKKHEVQTSILELASRAASRLKASPVEDIVTPKSAYQFEVAWRAFSDNSALQANLLKSIAPDMLPQLFKNALSAPILSEIIKCISGLFREETELSIRYLEYLALVPRFDMIIMCLPSKDKCDLEQMWEALSSYAIPVELAGMFCKLREKYCSSTWRHNIMPL